MSILLNNLESRFQIDCKMVIETNRDCLCGFVRHWMIEILGAVHRAVIEDLTQLRKSAPNLFRGESPLMRM